jgi:hypothetical protein
MSFRLLEILKMSGEKKKLLDMTSKYKYGEMGMEINFSDTADGENEASSYRVIAYLGPVFN